MSKDPYTAEFFGGSIDGQEMEVSDSWLEDPPAFYPIFTTDMHGNRFVDVYLRNDRRGRTYHFDERFVPLGQSEQEIEIELFPEEDDEDMGE